VLNLALSAPRGVFLALAAGKVWKKNGTIGFQGKNSTFCLKSIFGEKVHFYGKKVIFTKKCILAIWTPKIIENPLARAIF